MGVAYAAAVWLILQSADVLLDLFGVPSWGMRLIGVVLLLGFPVALVLSWIYELTPDGIRRDRGSTADQADTEKAVGRRLDVAIVMALFVVGGLIAWQQFRSGPGEELGRTAGAGTGNSAPAIDDGLAGAAREEGIDSTDH